MLYETPVWLIDTAALPVIIPGVEGTALSNKVLAGLEPQALVAVTLSVPDTNVLSKSTLTVFVPCPLMMFPPDGVVHAYAVAPVTASTE